jgi:hypothetical protein
MRSKRLLALLRDGRYVGPVETPRQLAEAFAEMLVLPGDVEMYLLTVEMPDVVAREVEVAYVDVADRSWEEEAHRVGP